MDNKFFMEEAKAEGLKGQVNTTQEVEDVTAAACPPVYHGDACIADSTTVAIDACKCIGVAEVKYDATENGKLIYVTVKATNLCPGRTLNVGIIVRVKGTPNIKAFKTVQFTPNVTRPCSSATLGPICILVHDNNCRKVEYDIDLVANYAGFCS